MAEVVFVLGAGCSVHEHAPLMSNFIDEAERLHVRNPDGPAAAEHRLVFKAIAALERSAAKSQLDLGNLESVFAAFEMASLISQPAELDQEELKQLPKAMQTVIQETLLETVTLPIGVDAAQENIPIAPDGYREIVAAIKSARAKGRRACVLTFNYDCCIDFSIESAHLPIDYCLKAGPALSPRELGPVRLLKLHGSLSWTSCRCQEPTAHRTMPFADAINGPAFTRLRGVRNKCPECKADRRCVIVPPTWSKGPYHESISSVWRAAAEELSDAQYIYIAGYSLPASDQFFRHLFAISTIGATRIKRVVVLDPDRTTEQRFRSLLGPAAINRFEHIAGPFRQNARSFQEEIEHSRFL